MGAFCLHMMVVSLSCLSNFKHSHCQVYISEWFLNGFTLVGSYLQIDRSTLEANNAKRVLSWYTSTLMGIWLHVAWSFWSFGFCLKIYNSDLSPSLINHQITGFELWLLALPRFSGCYSSRNCYVSKEWQSLWIGYWWLFKI